MTWSQAVAYKEIPTALSPNTRPRQSWRLLLSIQNTFVSDVPVRRSPSFGSCRVEYNEWPPPWSKRTTLCVMVRIGTHRPIPTVAAKTAFASVISITHLPFLVRPAAAEEVMNLRKVFRHTAAGRHVCALLSCVYPIGSLSPSSS